METDCNELEQIETETSMLKNEISDEKEETTLEEDAETSPDRSCILQGYGRIECFD